MREMTIDELVELTGIRKSHIKDIKQLTPIERRRFQDWLRANVSNIAGWTGIKPADIRAILPLHNEPSIADFKRHVSSSDLEAWGHLKEDRLLKLYRALETVDLILEDSLDKEDLLAQAIRHFAPEGADWGAWTLGIFEMKELVRSIGRYKGRGGRNRLPDWVEVVAGYLQFKGYDWGHFHRLMLVLGYFGTTAGQSKWREMRKRVKGPEWNQPEQFMPRMELWLKQGRRATSRN